MVSPCPCTRVISDSSGNSNVWGVECRRCQCHVTHSTMLTHHTTHTSGIDVVEAHAMVYIELE